MWIVIMVSNAPSWVNFNHWRHTNIKSINENIKRCNYNMNKLKETVEKVQFSFFKCSLISACLYLNSVIELAKITVFLKKFDSIRDLRDKLPGFPLANDLLYFISFWFFFLNVNFYNFYNSSFGTAAYF